MAARKQMAGRRLVAHNLRRLRQARNITQETLANAARLHQARISAIEAAKVNVSIDILQRIALALGTSLASFFEDVRSP